MPLLGDPGHRDMVACLEHLAERIPRPDALVVVSAHWEEALPRITAAPDPPLIYDYYGFPPESYEIRYPCAGEPALAAEIRRLLVDAGISAALDEGRGFDHGMFVPLKIMYPDADIPCVQVSLVNTLDPGEHIAMGRALGALADRGVLVVGSGFSFHNLKAFFGPDTEESRRLNQAFETWLADVCTNPDYTETERTARLIHWHQAPGARFCHPREEHLLPLHVCHGVGQGFGSQRFELNILGKTSSMYLWGSR